MRRSLIVASVLALMVGMSAASAWARGDGWEKVNNQPSDAPCGSTTVHVTFPVDEEYARSITLSDGTEEIQVTGRLITKFTTDDGTSVSFNTSGPQKFFFYTNGDFELRDMGLSGGPGFILSPSGEPLIFRSSGLLDIIFHPDGTITYVRTPHHVIDVCAALGLA